jgi:hypothetical protein
MGALEREEFSRCAWRVMVAVQVDAKRLVFVDEMGTNTSLATLYAWAPKGQRAYCSVPRNRGPNATVLSSMSAEGIGPSLSVEGATTSVVFEAYVEQVLAPAPRKGQVLVMDNLWPIKERGSKGRSSSGVASSSTCRPTLQISTPRGSVLEDQGTRA